MRGGKDMFKQQCIKDFEDRNDGTHLAKSKKYLFGPNIVTKCNRNIIIIFEEKKNSTIDQKNARFQQQQQKTFDKFLKREGEKKKHHGTITDTYILFIYLNISLPKASVLYHKTFSLQVGKLRGTTPPNKLVFIRHIFLP